LVKAAFFATPGTIFSRNEKIGRFLWPSGQWRATVSQQHAGAPQTATNRRAAPESRQNRYRQQRFAGGTAVKTLTPTPAEMESRICRYADLKSVKHDYAASKGIPAEAYAAIAANETFVLMAPEGMKSATGEAPPVIGGDGGAVFTVNIARCPPGDGPMLHAHQTTCETFFCLNGRFSIKWGDAGEHEVFLDPYDMIAMPPRIVRNFTNVSDEVANLLVFIQGDRDKFQDVEMRPEDGELIARRFGADVFNKLEAAGLNFQAGVAAETEAAE
jgi:uncharacterized RmlC-like cupin family protein